MTGITGFIFINQNINKLTLKLPFLVIFLLLNFQLDNPRYEISPFLVIFLQWNFYLDNASYEIFLFLIIFHR